MLAMILKPCMRIISSSSNGLGAKLWSCDLPSCLLVVLFELSRTIVSSTPEATTDSFFRGWPTSSFFRARKAIICSVEFLAFRICETHPACLAILILIRVGGLCEEIMLPG